MLFLLSPADVAFDGSGNKYEADLGHQAIIKYDSAGQYITHWSLFNAISIAVNLSTNQIYAGLVNNEVHIFDDRGNALHTFGNHGTGDGEFDGIKDIAIDDIYIYIADRSNHRVQIFNKTDRSFLTSVGGHGTGDGELKNPSGLTVGSGRQLYVADTDNNRIQLFTFDSGTSRWSYHSQFNLANPQSLYLNETTGGSNMLYVFHPALSNKWSSVPVTGHDLDPVDATSITTNSLESKVFIGKCLANQKELKTMAYPNSTLSFEQMLLQFMSEQDPMLSMLQWLCKQLMEAELAAKINAQVKQFGLTLKSVTSFDSGNVLLRYELKK